jgi:NAD(P)-dependent dehydrogenase (short-subunit alcohol dehydrogenase family)
MSKEPAKQIAVVTGSAGGIGGATVAALRELGFRVIGVDLHDAEIIADLATPEGRAVLESEVRRLAPDGLDVVVAAAGISPPPGDRVIETNYFGAVATLEALRPLLALRAPSSAIAISSSSSIDPMSPAVVEACLAGVEAHAVETGRTGDQMDIYGGSKRALALWVRRASITPEWAGAGIALNAIAPGLVRTGMTAAMIDDPETMVYLEKVVPRAACGPAEPWKLAETIVAIAALKATFLIGQTIFVDGGTTAIRVPDPFVTGTAPAP